MQKGNYTLPPPLRFGGMTLHSKPEGKKHYSPLRFEENNTPFTFYLY